MGDLPRSPIEWRRLVAVALLIHSVTAGADTVSDRDAASCVGRTCTVEGVVAEVYRSDKGNTFLNLGAVYPNQIVPAVVFERDSEKLPDFDSLEGQHVQLVAKVRLYKERPEIIITSPDQVISK